MVAYLVQTGFAECTINTSQPAGHSETEDADYILFNVSILSYCPTSARLQTSIPEYNTPHTITLSSVSSRHIAGEVKFPPGNSKFPGNFCWCKFLNVVPALLADTAVFKAFIKKMLPPGAIFELKIHQNA